MDQQIRGIPLGLYPAPDPAEVKIIYRTPPEFIDTGCNQLITLSRSSAPDVFKLTFWSWTRDYRYKPDIKGTWYSTECVLNKRQLHALQRMDFGGI